ncbi:hypothetical protein MMP71_07175 [Acinetobacter dispersus]|uniref:hypothetical protein n=1 Tax=Acinetobacter dispersus TaxID=70348 RepID=UPI001F4A8BFF|nr:hypothetical protein [Acinetobacter dispersus]MCH7383632.1 hypothetical protein [Acinetobacter dispersus]
MSIFVFKRDDKKIQQVSETSFGQEGIFERQDLQYALKENLEIIVPDCLVVAEEYSEWDQSRKRIDLLAIDRKANLVIIELKRTDSGDHMELQALRYASMISTMTFEHLIKVFTNYKRQNEQLDFSEDDAREEIEEFIGKDSLDIESIFGEDLRIVLISANFSKELTTSVIWLNERDLDITCIRIKPYKYNNEILLNIQQIIPLPEAKDYQIKAQQKLEERRNNEKKYIRDYSKYLFNGIEYNKRNLVLAVVKYHVETRGVNSFSKLIQDFPETLRNGRFYKKMTDVKNEERYFTSENEVFNFVEGCYVISNQWGLGNLSSFLEHSIKLGYEIVLKNNSDE